MGAYFELTLEKKVGSCDWTRIKRANEELMILLDIPANLIGADKTFSVIRSHESSLSRLGDLDSDNAKVTFKTG